VVVTMNVISVAVALPSGEMASGIIASVEGHPLLDLCGIARSLPDLARLLERFHPQVLLISPSLMEDMEPDDLRPVDASNLNASLSFLLSEPGMSWGEEELTRMLRFPLSCCGLIKRESSSGDDLFQRIKEKVAACPAVEKGGIYSREGGSGHGAERGLITVAGSKGGVGTTLFTCSLAAALSSAGRRVLLMEMDSERSQLLYLKPRDEGKTLLDLLPMAEEISWDMVRVSAYRHPAGFYLLPHGRSESGIKTADAAASEKLLRNLLFLFDMVVQDLSGPLSRDLLPMLHHSPLVLLVSLPDTLSATCARGESAFLRKTGLDHERLRLVVNRCGANHALRPDELARAAGIDLLATLPDDERSGLDFAELGELPRDDSPLGKAVAVAVAKLGFNPAPADRVSALQRLLRPRRRHHEDFFSGGTT
jgi:MinD-like ATPase involved in chromosome partitioning or flagellar assembly